MAPDPAPRSRGDEIISSNARFGLVLFAIYCAFYGAFVGISAFAPSLMGRKIFAGVNLAIVYGIGLILAAIVLALVYMWGCKRDIPEPSDGSERLEI